MSGLRYVILVSLLSTYLMYSQKTNAKGGCCMVINMILLHIAKAMYSRTSEVVIIPQFPIEETTFNMGQFNNPHSFSGVVDYLLAHVPPGNFCSKQPLCIVFLFLCLFRFFA